MLAAFHPKHPQRSQRSQASPKVPKVPSIPKGHILSHLGQCNAHEHLLPCAFAWVRRSLTRQRSGRGRPIGTAQQPREAPSASSWPGMTTQATLPQVCACLQRALVRACAGTMYFRQAGVLFVLLDAWLSKDYYLVSFKGQSKAASVAPLARVCCPPFSNLRARPWIFSDP